MLKSKLAIVSFIAGSSIFLGSQSAYSGSNFFAAAPANPYGGAEVDPLPITATIFTVTNGKTSTSYSMKSLLALKSKNISIYEPFVKKRQTFTVIPLSYFLSTNFITSTMKIETIALNNYSYSNSAGEFTLSKAYLAIKRAGMDIPYNQGGPIRIIFPNNTKLSKSLDAWNWSLSEIKVKKTG